MFCERGIVLWIGKGRLVVLLDLGKWFWYEMIDCYYYIKEID